jgi:hypothetical protein
MHDPDQDRLMSQRMAYFRIKQRRLGEAYERFLRDRLAPGGSIILVECRHSWPTTRLGPRHVFQVGGSGGATPGGVPPRRTTSRRVAGADGGEGAALGCSRTRWRKP